MAKKFKYRQNAKKFIAGGCSFTLGNELSDDVDGKTPSKNSWAYLLYSIRSDDEYVCTAKGGAGNSGIARRVFETIFEFETSRISGVAVMWSFPSRYDWAMPRHSSLEKSRWATITPWDTTDQQGNVFKTLANSEPQQEQWQRRHDELRQTGVNDFANALYKHAANEYHEIYLSWKSIIWLQNILVKHKIPYMFTLADNSLFYNGQTPHSDIDPFLQKLHKEIDLTKWFFFGQRNMGFNQWALLNDYKRGMTHPLDDAHRNAVDLMMPKYRKTIGENNV